MKLLDNWHVLPVIVGLAVAFFLGKGCTPEPEIHYELRTKTEWKERVVEVEKRVEVIKEVKVKSEVVRWKERIVEVVKTDGTVTKVTERVQDTETHEDTKKDTAVVDTTSKVVDTAAKTNTETVFDKKPSMPNWRAGLLAGINVPNLLLQNGLTGLSGAAIYGVGVERRLLGPFWVGAQVTSLGTGSLTLSLEF